MNEEKWIVKDLTRYGFPYFTVTRGRAEELFQDMISNGHEAELWYVAPDSSEVLVKWYGGDLKRIRAEGKDG